MSNWDPGAHPRDEAGRFAAFMGEWRGSTIEHPFDPRQRLSGNVGVEMGKFDGAIHISSIISYEKKNAGQASKVLHSITALADKYTVPLSLTAKHFGNAGARAGKDLSTKQLDSWYRRNGFVGKNNYLTRAPSILKGKP